MERFLCDAEMPYPELAMFALNQFSIPFGEYIRMAISVSKNCGIVLHVEENDARYRFDFYLCRSVIMGEYADEWCKLFGGSEMFTMAIDPQRPQTIRASFYRLKE